MSLHGRGQFETDATQPLPAAAPPPPPPPLAPGPATPPIWTPQPPPATYPGPYGGPYGGDSGGSWQGSGSGPWVPPGGGWRPPGAPLPPQPPRRNSAAIVVIAVVLVVVLAVVAVSYALSPAGRGHVATTPSPSPTISTPPTPLPSSPLVTTPAPTFPPSPAASALVAPPGPALSTAAVAAAVDPSIVDINTIIGGIQGGTAAGTGMVLTPSGVVLTNNHVIDGASSISAQEAGTTRRYAATLIGTDAADDVAVIQLSGASGMKATPFGDSSKVALRDRVVALGNALGRAGTPTVSEGIVVGLNRAITATDAASGVSEDLTGLIQTNAVLQPGDSGGPLVSASGQVIGMDTAASSRLRFNSGGVGYAIPINKALQIADEIRRGAFGTPTPVPAPTQRGYLGVQVTPSNAAGALVVGVISGGPAEAAGLMPGDSIVSVDGKAVTSSAGLTSLLSSHRPGDTVRVGWIDTLGLQHSASITLAAG